MGFANGISELFTRDFQGLGVTFRPAQPSNTSPGEFSRRNHDTKTTRGQGS